MIYEGSIYAQSGTVKIDMTRISLLKNLNAMGTCVVFIISEKAYSLSKKESDNHR